MSPEAISVSAFVVTLLKAYPHEDCANCTARKTGTQNRAPVHSGMHNGTIQMLVEVLDDVRHEIWKLPELYEHAQESKLVRDVANQLSGGDRYFVARGSNSRTLAMATWRRDLADWRLGRSRRESLDRLRNAKKLAVELSRTVSLPANICESWNLLLDLLDDLATQVAFDNNFRQHLADGLISCRQLDGLNWWQRRLGNLARLDTRTRCPGDQPRPNDLITQDEAAEMMGVSDRTIMRRVDDGILEGYGAKGSRRVSRSEVEEKADQIRRSKAAR